MFLGMVLPRRRLASPRLGSSSSRPCRRCVRRECRDVPQPARSYPFCYQAASVFVGKIPAALPDTLVRKLLEVSMSLCVRAPSCNATRLDAVSLLLLVACSCGR